jgi:polyhydroxybutyrate depolymerase
MGRVIVFSSVILVTVVAFASGTRDEHFLEVNGAQRRYLLHAPRYLKENVKVPLILVLHGAGGTPENTVWLGIEKYSVRKGFIVVYPEGIDRSWNDGRPIEGRSYDDVGFLSALIEELVAKQNVDPKRVYVTGISNGGFMAFALACRVPDKIAATAPVAASMGVGALEKCHPSKSLSVLMINGTADPLVKFEGGRVQRQGSDAEPVAKVAAFWRAKECGANPRVLREELPDVNFKDESTVEVERVQCPGNEVINYTVRGGGHTWPGGIQYLPKFIVGNVNRDFSASQAIVEFFARH